MSSNTHSFPALSYKKNFPIFKQKIYGKDLVFLDTAASAQKPQCVIDSVAECYSDNYSNIHRGIYYLSSKLTVQYESVREKIAEFINADSSKEIIFTKSATEALNLLASCMAKSYLKEGDEVLISYLEHHANILPWQLQCFDKNVKLTVAELNKDTTLNTKDLLDKISDRTKLISITHMSNTLGHINDIRTIASEAKKRGIPVIVDGCQYIAHNSLDVQELGCDFYVFSGHKIYGPTGVGVLYGKKDWLDSFPPYQGGGDMIKEVTFEKSTYAAVPQKFEAGTPPISQVIGLGTAIDYVSDIGLDNISSYEKFLYQYAYEAISDIPNLKVIGHSKSKGGILSFTMDNMHESDVATILDQDAIAIRTGHHCTMPLIRKLGLTGTARLSIGLYNIIEDVDKLRTSLKKLNKVFK